MYIEIRDHKRGFLKKLIADGDMFSGEVDIVDFDNRVEFRRTGLDWNGKGYTLNKSGDYYYTEILIDLPTGVQKIDEESNEDLIIIYK